MISDAEPVIAQNLNDTAFSGLAWIVRLGHSREFFSELRQNGHAAIHSGELFAGDFMCRGTVLDWFFGKCHQISDVIETEAKFPCVPQESEAFERGFVIAPLTPFRSGRRRDQAALFIVADRRHFHTRAARHLAD